ncbi:MAG: PEP-CTERM sorting domain-containing protein [Halioglobus sp.]|nr:PEP-CTERM sorting domain-containing protein [Halioglobus sp.]
MRFPLLQYTSAILIAAILALGAPQSGAVTILVGDKDGGSPGDAADAAMPSADLARVTANSGRIMKDSDDDTRNRFFGTTFNLPGPIVSATLRFSIEALSNFPETDRLLLGFADAGDTTLADSVVYDRLIGDDGGEFGLFASALSDGTFDRGDVVTAALDLSALPQIAGPDLDLLGAINTAGFLDVTLHDDNIVDYVELDYTSTAIPVPATLLLLGSALMALGLRRTG